MYNGTHTNMYSGRFKTVEFHATMREVNFTLTSVNIHNTNIAFEILKYMQI